MVNGHCDDRFSAVADELERNFAERGELGASVCVTVDGETVVDLWGGHADAERSRPWEKDTITCVMSSTKGVASLAVHLLAARGELDLDEPVATYWPEFAANGKDGVLVRHLLNHQAGVPALREPLPEGGFYDWDLVTRASPLRRRSGSRARGTATTRSRSASWSARSCAASPGAASARSSRDEIAAPLGDGRLDRAARQRARPIRAAPRRRRCPNRAIRSRASTSRCSPIPRRSAPRDGQQRRLHGAGGVELTRRAARRDPRGGRRRERRGLATMYRAIVHDRVVGRYRLEPEDVARMGAVESAATYDAVLSSPGRWTLGYLKAAASHRGVVPPTSIALSDEAFGHTGNGGSIGFADPGCAMSFGYVMNQMNADMGLAPTGQSLVDAVYRRARLPPRPRHPLGPHVGGRDSRAQGLLGVISPI